MSKVRYLNVQPTTSEQTTALLDASIRQVQLDKARRAYAASLAKVLAVDPPDWEEAYRIASDALADAQHLIALLERGG